MIHLLVAASIAFAATPVDSVSTPEEIDVGNNARWTLLSGLENQLRGKFVITGLKDAKIDCDLQKSCRTRAGIADDAQSMSLPANALEIFGKPVVAFVSVLTAKRSGEMFDVILSVYDTKSGIVTQRRAEMGYRNGNVGALQLRRLVTVDP